MTRSLLAYSPHALLIGFGGEGGHYFDISEMQVHCDVHKGPR